MRRRAPLFAFIATLAAWPALAQPVIVSPAPDSVAVTIYGDPDREEGEFIDFDDELEGFALISETRTVDLPPGEVTIRFEGVASGIQPETAIVQGAEPREKNQDRLLLSERGLVDAFTGQRVIVRRTDRATGKVTEERARIRSSHDGIILQTDAGFESLHCTGLARAPIYPGVPTGLSAKPVLSMTTRSQAGGRQQITLSYLTDNFDWQANYVGRLSADATRVDLFAWVTLASLDDVGFEDANASIVAGRALRTRGDEDAYGDDEDDEDYWYSCWPDDTTGLAGPHGTLFRPDPLPVIEAPIAIRADQYWGYGGGDGADIIVTGSRIMRPEDFNDFKLYRVPQPVTVASRSQKQVAFLDARRVKGELLYRSFVEAGEYPDGPQLVYRIRNLERDGLGQPLPMGQVTLFQDMLGRRMLVGETQIEDKAVGEDVELVLDEPEDVDVEVDEDWVDDSETRRRHIVTNESAFPVRYEAEFGNTEYYRIERFSRRTALRKGKRVWSVMVPPQGERRIDYRVIELDPEEDDESDLYDSEEWEDGYEDE